MASKAETCTRNKGDLIAKLRELGMSRRAAVIILNSVLREIAAALQRGEAVELPFGTLQKARHAHRPQQGRFLNRNTAIYKKPFTVALKVDAAGEKLLNGTKKK